VSYINFKGELLELDGLQPGPISYGPVTEENWLERAREEIQGRIQRYEASELRFTLLAITGDKRDAA
jgi:ubiquitin carboxyl-terminal hydrolase L5